MSVNFVSVPDIPLSNVPYRQELLLLDSILKYAPVPVSPFSVRMPNKSSKYDEFREKMYSIENIFERKATVVHLVLAIVITFCPSSVRPSVCPSIRYHFQTSPLKLLSQFCSNFIWSLLRWGGGGGGVGGGTKDC